MRAQGKKERERQEKRKKERRETKTEITRRALFAFLEEKLSSRLLLSPRLVPMLHTGKLSYHICKWISIYLLPSF